MRTLRAFIDFVTCYNTILSHQKKIKTIELSLSDLAQHIAELRDSITKKHKEIFEQRKAIDAQELELKILDVQEADKKKRLENAHTVKEFQSLTSELEIINAKKNTIESSLFESITALENFKKLTSEFETDTQNTLAKLQEQEKNLEFTKNQHIQTLENLRQDCLQKRQLVNKEMLARFEEMQKQVENPAVPIINDSCSACFYAVSAADIGSAKKGDLLQCKDCYRLLYLE